MTTTPEFTPDSVSDDGRYGYFLDVSVYRAALEAYKGGGPYPCLDPSSVAQLEDKEAAFIYYDTVEELDAAMTAYEGNGPYPALKPPVQGSSEAAQPI